MSIFFTCFDAVILPLFQLTKFDHYLVVVFFRNAARVAAITYVSGGVVFVGKIFITSLTTGAAYLTIDTYLGEALYSVIGPLFFIAMASWFIAGMFMSVYDMGIATILQCFVADEEMFSPDQRYAEGGLKDWVDSHKCD
jgi:hypothetical protein